MIVAKFEERHLETLSSCISGPSGLQSCSHHECESDGGQQLAVVIRWTYPSEGIRGI